MHVTASQSAFFSPRFVLSCRLAGVVHPHLEVLHKIALHAKGIRVRSDTHKTACLYIYYIKASLFPVVIHVTVYDHIQVVDLHAHLLSQGKGTF